MFIRAILFCFVFKLICGDDIEKRLIDRYNDLRMECVDGHKYKKPAFQCTGLMIRAVDDIGGSQQKYAWSKKPSNVRRNAFSTTFLRRDQQFYQLHNGYETGFIYYPQLKTPCSKYAYRAYCAFPVNAGTESVLPISISIH